MNRWATPSAPVNPFSRLPPSRRLIAAARAAGVTGGTAEIDAWAKESGWTGVKSRTNG